MTVGGRNHDFRADAGQAIAQCSHPGHPVLQVVQRASHDARRDRRARDTDQAGSRPVAHRIAASGRRGESGRRPRQHFPHAGERTAGRRHRLYSVARKQDQRHPAHHRSAEAEIIDAEITIAEADTRLGRPFKHADELTDAYARSVAIAAKVAAHAEGTTESNE